MALITSPSDTHALIADNASDYGSDLDEETVEELLSQADSQPLKNLVLESIEDPIIKNESVQEHVKLRFAGPPQSQEHLQKSRAELESIVLNRRVRENSAEVEYDQRNRTSFSPSNREERAIASPEPGHADKRSPLERFRKRRPLSVTDLVSPAWCEQQYEYSLTRYGRVRKTPAMKQGSTVHKELEDEVHVRVPVEVVSSEDRFGLRIWNTVQGLRSLRETGLTRELEVWGVLEGEVVIGIIDEISTVCPDEQMEATILEEAKAKKKGAKRRKSTELPSGQHTLTNFLTSSQNGSSLESHPAFLGTLQERSPTTYYIIDIKTRQSKTLPAPGSQSRPTHMQLMLYHRLLSSLAANDVPADRIFARYNLQPHATFSDKFIAEIANLDMAALGRVNLDGDPSPRNTQTEDSLTELLEHNTVSSLWSLLIAEFAKTLPIYPARSPISPLLTAEFRTGRTTYADADETEVLQAAGQLIGKRSFAFDGGKVNAFVQDEIKWWKGDRETKGVEIEEAFKCRICEFAEVCTWRATKVEEGLRKAKLRSETRKRSEV